jgi:hypothetical protein
MSQLLDRIRSEIHERREVCRAAVEESARLEAALIALGNAQPRAAAVRSAEPSAAAPGRATRKAAAKRAPRGANRAAVLEVLGDRPGVGVAELSSASGVKKPVLYALLNTLVEEGEVVKEELPGGGAGYALRREEEAGWTAKPTAEPTGTPQSDAPERATEAPQAVPETPEPPAEEATGEDESAPLADAA